MEKCIIAPSIISADWTRLKDEIQAIEAAGADWLHVDVMDGHFVPNMTFGPFVVDALKKLTKMPLDVHLMIQHPEKWVEQYAKSGANWITVHPEAEGNAHRALELARNYGAKPALALKPATPVSAAEEYADEIEMLLVMTVNPGFSGQKMIADCLPKYKEARRLLGYDILLEIDGGVMPENIKAVKEAGAQAIVAATAIFKAPDYKTAIGTLRSA